MSVFLRAAVVALLVALGFLAGRFTHAPKRAPDALATFRDAPQSLVAVATAAGGDAPPAPSARA